MLDCPPSLGLLTVNALVAADHALLSTEAQYFALQGVEQALEVIELARDGLNPDLRLARRRLQHRRHAHAPQPRGATPRCASTSARKLFDDDDPPVDRLRRGGRARASRSSTTGPTSAPTTSRSPTRSSQRLKMPAARERLKALAEA